MGNLDGLSVCKEKMLCTVYVVNLGIDQGYVSIPQFIAISLNYQSRKIELRALQA